MVKQWKVAGISKMETPPKLLQDMDVLVSFFDRWWTLTEAADYVEIKRGYWKTRECYSTGADSEDAQDGP